VHYLQKILDRPQNEKAFVLIPVGYPAEIVTAPNIQRKQLEEISVWL